MPTVAHWLQALSRNYHINLQSSKSLCDEVLVRQRRRDQERRESRRRPVEAKGLVAWPSLGRQERVLVRPVDLLHAIGRITTPPVTELIDLSSTWAEIRYLWAFQPNFDSRFVRSLRLSRTVKELDFHQKTLLSDEFGIGFAAHYMMTFERATDPVDAFIARRRGQAKLRGSSRRTLPDYIFKGPLPNQYYIVECKGSQSNRSTIINQLQRGSEQVLAVDIDKPASATRLVIGAWLKGTVTILVIDPPDDKLRKVSHWSANDLSSFARAKLLTYIGDYAKAKVLIHNLVESPEPLIAEGRNTELRKTDFGVFIGSEQVRLMPDARQIRMFRGIKIELHKAILDEAKPREHPPQDNQISEKGWTFASETINQNGIATVRSVSGDGSLFEVQIS